MLQILKLIVSVALTFAASVHAAEPVGLINTVADPVLKKDIIANLIGTHRIYHPACKDAQVASAKTLTVAREKVSEEWVLRGCGRAYPYTVELIPDGKGGVWISIPRDPSAPSVAKALGCKAPHSSREDWYKIGDSAPMTHYANVSSIRLDGSIAAIWLLLDYKALQRESSGAFMSDEMLAEFDCKENKTRLVAANARAENMAAGAVVSCDSKAYQWRPVRRGTVEEAAAKIACDPEAKYRYCTAPSFNVSDWIKLSESREETNYVNAKSARRIGDIASIWILNDYQSAQVAAPGTNYLSVEIKYEINCKANTRRMASQFAWDGQMAGGKQVACNLNREEWKPIRSSTLGEEWRDIACKVPASQ